MVGLGQTGSGVGIGPLSVRGATDVSELLQPYIKYPLA
jgi:hypothetical protein